MGIASAPPVDHHTGLRQREGQEDADGKQGDQGVGLATEGDIDYRRRDREQDDPVAEGEAIAHAQKEPWRVLVARQQEQYAREVVVGSVRRQQQDRRRRRLRESVHESRAEAAMGELREDGLVRIWHDERVSRCGKQDACLAYAAQVSCEQHGDHTDPDRDGGRGE